MAPFTPLPDRDAYATIRGFIYQVDLSIDRWLLLQPGQVLQLEAGEDIDLIVDALNTTPNQMSRLLDQVKHREQSLTLRSKSALESISNAILLRDLNPGHALKFRYSTNAKIGKEQPIEVGKPLTMPMLTLWEKLRTNVPVKLADSDTELTHADAVSLLRRFISSLSKPEGFNDAAWTHMTNFFQASSEAVILELVSVIEWATGGTTADNMQPRIEQQLLDLGLAADGLHATQLYERLFLHVFRLLSQRGEKRLTPDGLIEQKNLPVLEEADRQLLVSVRERLEFHHLKINAMETVLSTLVSRLAVQEDITCRPEFNLAPRIDPPGLPEPYAFRSALVHHTVNALGDARWSIITGVANSGKSTFALLMAQQLGVVCKWVRLPAGEDLQVTAALERALAVIAGTNPTANRRAWLGQVCSAAGRGSSIVVDPLPDLVQMPDLADRVRGLAVACREHGVHLITVTSHPLPSSVLSAVLNDSRTSFEVPLFSISETKELLTAYGAPAVFCSDQRVQFLHSLTRGQPVLLGAAAQFLKGTEWNLDEDVIQELLAGDHHQAIADDVMRRLVGTVTDHARQLLYRLSLAWTSVTRTEIDAVGNVPPAVPHRSEALTELVGPWMVRSGSGELRLSPLVRTLGDGLDPAVCTACHAALGEALLKRNEIGMLESLEAVSHFELGGQLDKAATFFLMSLVAVREASDLQVGEPLISLWAHRRMPDEMNCGIRLLARSYQLMLRAERGLANETILADLHCLISEATERDHWAVPIAASFGSMSLASVNPNAAVDLALRAIQTWDQLRGPAGEFVPLELPIAPEHLLWGVVPHFRTVGHFEHWFSVLKTLGPPSRAKLFDFRHGALGCIVLTNLIIDAEARKPGIEQNWDEVTRRLEQILEIARSINMELLQGAALRGLVRVQAEFQRRLDQSLASAARGDELVTSAARYLVASEMGRQATVAQQYSEARTWLKLALALEPAGFPNDPLFVRYAASAAFGNEDSELGVVYAADSVRIVEATPEFSAVERAAAISTHAYAVYLRDGVATAATFWLNAAERILDAEENSLEWRCLAVTFGSGTALLASVATTGNPPSRNIDGSAYTAPIREAFVCRSTAISGLFSETRFARSLFLIGQLAQWSGDLQTATRFNQIAFQRSQSAGDVSLASFCTLQLTVSRILGGEYQESIEEERSARQRLTAMLREEQTGQEADRPGFNLAEAIAALSEADRRQIEEEIARNFTFPVVVHLLSLSIVNPQECETLARRLVLACRAEAATAVNQELWNLCARLVESAFLGNATRADLKSLVSSAGTPLVASAIGWLCAAQQGSVAESVADQLAVFSRLGPSYRRGTTVHDQLLIPYLTTFWNDRLTNRTFEVHAPANVKRSFEEACQARLEHRIRRILLSALSGVRIGNMPEEIASWLHGLEN
jgi:hypothetical protein